MMTCYRDWLLARRANGFHWVVEWWRRADYHAMAGEFDEAFSAYDHMLSSGFFSHPIPFEEYPTIRALEGDPRHSALVERYYKLLNEQRRLLDLPPVRPREVRDSA